MVLSRHHLLISGPSQLRCLTYWHSVWPLGEQVFGYQICDGAYFLLGTGWSATPLAVGFQQIM